MTGACVGGAGVGAVCVCGATALVGVGAGVGEVTGVCVCDDCCDGLTTRGRVKGGSGVADADWARETSVGANTATVKIRRDNERFFIFRLTFSGWPANFRE